MKQRNLNISKQLLSFIILVVFTLLSVGSNPGSANSSSCGDIRNLESEPIFKDFTGLITLRVVDKETGVSLQDINMDFSYFQYNCNTIVNCNEECFMELQPTFDGTVTFDSEGFVTLPYTWLAVDKKDKMLVDMSLKDNNFRYAPLKATIQLDQENTTGSYTLGMLNLENL